MIAITGVEGFELHRWDVIAFAAYFVVLCAVGWWAGRKEKVEADDYFLAGRTLPWYVVGSSFIASNISTEHFIGMIGAAYIYGICVAMAEWMNILSFTVLIWFFIPFLLASRVFTTPEFMERRFNPTLRHFFAIVTVISNVVAFLAAVLYGGGLALDSLFHDAISQVTQPVAEFVYHGPPGEKVLAEWNLWFAILALGIVAGSWAIYGGLSSVAWTDFFTVIVMVIGGLMITILGLHMLAGDGGSLLDGWRVMIERNQAKTGDWAEAVAQNAQHMARTDDYDRLSVIQPVTHAVQPWPNIIFGLFSISIWYNVINQFMIQRVLGARSMYHARMGIVLAGYMKAFLPFIIVVPGLILFAAHPEGMLQPWDAIQTEADRGYVRMLKALIPVGLRGLFLAALFGAIQSTVNSVLNSTATVFTIDIYQRTFARNASQKSLVRMGMISSVVILLIAMVLGGYINRFDKGGLFVYIQTLYAFFAPPFSAVFVLGILFRRINAQGATAAVLSGFGLGIGMKVFFQLAGPSAREEFDWLEPFAMQAIVNWAFCVIVCVGVSLLTAPPPARCVTDELTFNWRKLNIFGGLGEHWYSSVVLWWAAFVLIILALLVVFSGAVL